MKFTISIPREMVDEVRKATALEGGKRGGLMFVSEWIREAIQVKLDSAGGR